MSWRMILPFQCSFCCVPKDTAVSRKLSIFNWYMSYCRDPTAFRYRRGPEARKSKICFGKVAVGLPVQIHHQQQHRHRYPSSSLAEAHSIDITSPTFLPDFRRMMLLSSFSDWAWLSSRSVLCIFQHISENCSVLTSGDWLLPSSDWTGCRCEIWAVSIRSDRVLCGRRSASLGNLRSVGCFYIRTHFWQQSSALIRSRFDWWRCLMPENAVHCDWFGNDLCRSFEPCPSWFPAGNQTGLSAELSTGRTGRSSIQSFQNYQNYLSKSSNFVYFNKFKCVDGFQTQRGRCEGALLLSINISMLK